MQIATLAATRRNAEQMRLLTYWLNQRSVSIRLEEPFALAEFEFHRILCEATQNLFLRAASALVEFGVVQATAPPIRAGVEEMALEKAAFCDALAQGIAAGNTDEVGAAMAQVLAIDRHWILQGTLT